MPAKARSYYVGTSGWAIARSLAPGSSPQATGLERYAEYFNCVEINSTFHRLPRPSTLERWRDSTPREFRFAVKMPRAITHEAELGQAGPAVAEFFKLMTRLEPKLGPLLVQLPPGRHFERPAAEQLFQQLGRAGAGQVVLEPRHPSWFAPELDDLLQSYRVARVAADPPPVPEALRPGGSSDLTYFRWHGSPQMYFSSYTPEALHSLARRLRAAASTDVYCFFDNTALGAAGVNALSLKAELGTVRP